MPDSPFMGFSGPLYDQVHKHLRARILAGEWEHWQPLPPEVMLSQELGVSVGTVRKAMEKLMQEKIVIRERGRGTFVRRDSNQRLMPTLALRDRDGLPVEPEIRLTAHSTGSVSGRAARLFVPKLSTSATLAVTTFEREWHIADRLVCREIIVAQLQPIVGPSQSDEPSREELLARYIERSRLQTHSVRWDVGSHSAFAADGGDYGISDPRVVLTRYASNSNGDVCEVCEHLVSVTEHTFDLTQ